MEFSNIKNKNKEIQNFSIDQYQNALMVASNKNENDVVKVAFKFE
ncbi:MAG: hypothetical protein ACFE94_16200 [Candidatus Hodarchaeota archaeon]